MTGARGKAGPHVVLGAAVLAIVASLAAARAERLPVRAFTIADGLPHDVVRRIVPDRPGFLWICTDEGLARYDGERMTAFGTAEGLPGVGVLDVLEARDGSYWVATDRGVAVYDPARPPARLGNPPHRPFEPVVLPGGQGNQFASQLHEEPDGTIWCATRHGIARVRRAAGGGFAADRELLVPPGDSGPFAVRRIRDDGAGGVWIATRYFGLLRVRDGKFVERFTMADGLPTDDVRDVVRDPEGTLWVATSVGLCRFATDARPGRAVERVYRREDGLASSNVLALLATPRYPLVVLSLRGAAVLRSGARDGPAFERFTAGQGLSGDNFICAAEDRDGNLWLGSDTDGLYRISRGGVTAYGVSDGLELPRVQALAADGDGRTVVVTDIDDRQLVLHRFDGRRFHATSLRLPAHVTYMGWGWDRTVARDPAGSWWVATGDGLLRYDGARRVEDLGGPIAPQVYTTRDGLPTKGVFRTYVDGAGDLWAAIDAGALGRPTLVRRERATGRIEAFTRGVPTFALPTSFAEDGRGGLWIGFADGTLLRRAHGEFQRIGADAGLPPRAGALALHIDRRGRLWVGTDAEGAGIIDTPEAPSPRFVRVTTATGLSSAAVHCITEDRFGRIYFGTGKGVDRLDPATGRVRHLSASDGLPGNIILSCRTDPDGTVWFAASRGVARLGPTPDAAPTAPEVLIDDVRAGGSAVELPPVGRKDLTGIELASDQRSVEIRYLALDYGSGEVLRFRYRLVGADEGWSALAAQRTVRFANLAPGSYRFEVLAYDADGSPSARPATVAFVIRPPVWRRWWFIALASLAVSAAAYGAHRLRVGHAVALERIRTRISGELHDDIGSSLSQIAILSEVALREPPGSATANQRLSSIATLAREVGGDMSDVVWALNPRRDRFDELVRRVRSFGEEACEARGIAFRFASPEPATSPLDADTRRQVLLLARESLNNAVRHADARTIELKLELEGDVLVFSCRDDGHGFDLAAPRDGNGLDNMERRARALGAPLEFETAPRCGTTVALRVRLGRRRTRTYPIR